MNVTQGVFKNSTVYGLKFIDKYENIKTIITIDDYNSKFSDNDNYTISPTSTYISDDRTYYNNADDCDLIKCDVETGRFVRCRFSGSGNTINDGYFDTCNFSGYTINGGRFVDCYIDDDSIWNNGIWDNKNVQVFKSSWHNGIWNGGTYNDIRGWSGGTFNGGTFNGDISGDTSNKCSWYGGTANGGDFLNVDWYDGLVSYANFTGCTFTKGLFNDGIYTNCIFSGKSDIYLNGGLFYDCKFNDVIINNGSIFGVKSITGYTCIICGNTEINGGNINTAKIQNAHINNVYAENLDVYDGNFYNGEYENSIFNGGDIFNGTYYNISGLTSGLTIRNGIFRNSLFSSGVTLSGVTIQNGNFINCKSFKCNWEYGVYSDGEMYDSNWKDGYWNDGIFSSVGTNIIYGQSDKINLKIGRKIPYEFIVDGYYSDPIFTIKVNGTTILTKNEASSGYFSASDFDIISLKVEGNCINGNYITDSLCVSQIGLSIKSDGCSSGAMNDQILISDTYLIGSVKSNIISTTTTINSNLIIDSVYKILNDITGVINVNNIIPTTIYVYFSVNISSGYEINLTVPYSDVIVFGNSFSLPRQQLYFKIVDFPSGRTSEPYPFDNSTH